MSQIDLIIQKVSDRSAVVGIVGLGYVGLPLSLRFSEVGFKVIGLDIDPEKPRQLEAGKSYIRHFSDERVRQAVQQGFEATTDFARAGQCDALVLCVPTPLDKYREPDISFVTNTMDSLLPHLQAASSTARKSITSRAASSTNPRGDTEESVGPMLMIRGWRLSRFPTRPPSLSD